MKHTLNIFIYLNVQHKDNWDVRRHLLSLLWSNSPSRQMIRHIDRTVIRIPAAWLRLEEAGVKSSPSVVCLSTVLQRELIYFNLLELNLRHLMIRLKKKGLYLRQTTHSFCVPHEQILTLVRLQQELWDTDAC